MERVRAQGGIGAPVSDHGGVTLGGIGGQRFHQAAALFAERVEELLEGGLVPADRRPDQASGVVVHHDGQVLVPFL